MGIWSLASGAHLFVFESAVYAQLMGKVVAKVPVVDILALVYLTPPGYDIR